MTPQRGRDAAVRRAMPRGGRALTVAIVLLAALAGLVDGTARGAAAAADGPITVCPAGPPACDYQAIQPALDAAAGGDTVLVEAGVYTGPLALKSHVRLEGRDGPEATTITAGDGPLLAASGVVSAVVSGLSMRGGGVLTHAVGIDLENSQVSVRDCILGDLQGRDGIESRPDGEPATGIRVTGTSALTVSQSTLAGIRGGDGFANVESPTPAGTLGGEATAISMVGAGRLAIAATDIRAVAGGAAGAWCGEGTYAGTGGAATAIFAHGPIDLVIEESEIVGLEGGRPCQDTVAFCPFGAGPFFGVRATGGTVTLRNNRVADLRPRAAQRSEPNCAVRTSATLGTVLERNAIRGGPALGPAAVGVLPAHAASPFCIPPPIRTIGVSSEGDSSLILSGNSIADLEGTGAGGRAEGVAVGGTAVVQLSGNSVTGLWGGSQATTTAGFRLVGVGTAQIDANALGEIRGGEIPEQFYYAFFGVDGGHAAGIELASVTTATVTNNAVWAVAGGRGTTLTPLASIPGRDGGNATALLFSGGSARIVNNSFRETAGGRGGAGNGFGQDGRAVGIRLAGAGPVTLANNALAGHGTGISSTLATAPSLAHNDLWANQTDYAGLAPGASDRHAEPAFVDAQLHIGAGSPLIDAGTSGFPAADRDGEPRPVDGNDDGAALADIGADEFWPSLWGSAKTVDKRAAKAGDLLTYQLTLVNASSRYDLPEVQVSDPIPSHTTYVEGSLWAASGSAAYADGAIHWSGAVAFGAPVTVRFKVAVDALTGRCSIVNQAVLDDRLGAPRTIRATTLIDPLCTYFPAVPARPTWSP